MKILNFLWHYSTGGIGKCYLTYNQLQDVNPMLEVKSVCVILDNRFCDIQSLKENGIEIIHIKGYTDFSWLIKLAKISKEFMPDYFFCHGHNGPILITLYKVLLKDHTPLICTCHGTNLNEKKLTGKLFLKIWMCLYKSQMVKKIICVEQFTPMILCKKGVSLGKITTVYNGIKSSIDIIPVDIDEYRKKDCPVIITASRLTRIKGINYLLDALKIIKEKGVGFTYICIGNGEEEDTLKQQTRNLGLENDVYFVGYQNNVPEWLASCDIFVLPSLEEFHSIAILEAMRAKKVIIATNVGGNPESLRDGKDAILVPSKDAKSLADALIKVILTPGLCSTLIENAYNRFQENFTVEVMKQNLVREIMSIS